MPSLRAGEVELHYEDRGSGTPVLLIHGAASSSVCLAALIDELAEPDRRLIAPDLRGMGRSSRIESMEPSSWSDDIGALIEALGLERLHLCGTSLGARIAVRVALEHPERVASLTLDALILHDSERGGEQLEAIFGAAAPPAMAENLIRWNGADGRRVGETYLRLRRTPGLQEHYDLREEIAALRCPTLFTRGDVDDEIHPVSHTVDGFAKVAGAWLWIAPATGFSAMRFQPADAARHIRELIASTD